MIVQGQTLSQHFFGRTLYAFHAVFAECINRGIGYCSGAGSD